MKKNLKSILSRKILSIVAVLFAVLLLAGCGNQAQEVKVDGIEISKKNLYLAEGQTAVISAQVYPFNASNQDYSFESNNESVVTIEDGFVTAKKAGTATIYVYSTEGGYKDSCNVLVTTAGDNLALNQYNNLNMPPKDLEPIYYGETAQTNSKSVSKILQKPTFSKPKPTKTGEKKSLKDAIKSGVKQVKAEVSQDIEAGKKVLDDMKDDLKKSVDFIEEQKESVSAMFSEMFADTQDSFLQSVQDFQTKMYDEMQTMQQNIMQSIESTKQKIDSEEYTVESGDINGVTFVVIKNAEN
ncbi:MAG: Ig-like domain-containing protein [Clostridia bacterium]|nr:Ig-like domain-containing protein [Clostridia bacterium]